MKGAACRTKRTIVIVTLALAGCRAPVQAPTATPEVEPLYFVTTGSMSPLLLNLANGYSRDNTLVGVVDQSHTGITLQDVLDGEGESLAPFALTTYLPGEGLWAAPIGQDGIAIITHPALRVPGLTANDLRNIFSGQITNWQSFINLDLPLVVVSLPEQHPTRLGFEDLVMGQRRLTLNARLAPTEAAMVDIVVATPGAIGIVSLTLASGRVRLVPVAAGINDPLVSPSLETIGDGSYPLRMPLLVVGNAAPQPGDGYYEFIVWMQQKRGQQIVSQMYAPLPE